MDTLQLLTDIQNKNVPVSDLLRKAKVIASKLGDAKFLKWVNLELSGYGKDRNCPAYRRVHGQVNYLHPYYGWKPVVFGTSEWEDKVSYRACGQSIGEIEELLNSKSRSYEMPFPASIAAQILKDAPFPAKVSLFIDSSALVGTLNAVRNRLFDWALALEQASVKDSEVMLIKEQSQTVSGTPETSPALLAVQPRLIVQSVDKTGKKKIGFLQLSERDKMRRIAGIETRQFRLIRCLFSPSGDDDAPYAPVFQSRERICAAIALTKDKTDSRLKNPATKDSAMHDIIENTIKEIQKNRGIREYLRFDWNSDKVRMRITLPEGNESEG